MGNPVVHWEIATSDSKKMVDFYSKLFDWDINPAEGMDYNLVAAGGEGGIGGGIFPTQGDMPTYLTMYVQVDNLQASLDSAVSLGAKAIMQPTEIPTVGSFAMFADPEGNTIGLYKGSESG